MYFEDVTVGQTLPTLTKRPGATQLFRFSAATGNAHRIHYDLPYARAEGYPGVLVQAHLHGCFLAQTVLDWAGERATLRRFRWENRGIAVADTTLTCSGRVVATHPSDSERGEALVDVELEERDQDGALCAPAWATVSLPRRAAGAEADPQNVRRA